MASFSRLRHVRKLIGLTFVVSAVGVLLVFAGPGRSLEREAGLAWLYELRGERPAPSDVAVVAIENQRRPDIDVPGCDLAGATRLDTWPRCLHAALIDRLAAQSPSAIVLDIAFTRKGPKDADTRLAQSIAAAGNVILFQKIATNRPAGGGTAAVQRLLGPLPALKTAAAAQAPFALPKVPVRVDRFWAFKPGVGGAPTLPAMALALHARDHLPEILTALRDSVPDGDLPSAEAFKPSADAPTFTSAIRRLREVVRAHPEALSVLGELHTQQSPAHKRRAGLAGLLVGPDSYEANFYGTPGRIPTVRAEMILGGETPDLAGKVVFVGEAREVGPSNDGFYTVYSRDDGTDLSGVEIAATAFANLLNQETLKPAGPGSAGGLLLAFGALATLLAFTVAGVRGVLAVVSLAAVYVAGAHLAFARADVWLPLATPLLIQTPLACLGGLGLQYLVARQERQNAAHAVSYYVPASVAENLTKTGTVAPTAELRQGVLLATDIAGYTTFSEEVPPGEVHAYMNRYFGVMATAMGRRGAVVTQTLADSMMGVWSEGDACLEVRRDACAAALETLQALRDLPDPPDGRPHATRMGLHVGWFAIGHVGGGGHYNFSVTGDTPNVASRLENMNKTLGTQILVSGDVLVGLDQTFLIRRMGAFPIRGRSHTLEVCELLAFQSEATADLRALYHTFEAALSAYEAGHWQDAAKRFEALKARWPDDGPTNYYLEQLTARQLAEPATGRDAL